MLGDLKLEETMNQSDSITGEPGLPIARVARRSAAEDVRGRAHLSDSIPVRSRSMNGSRPSTSLRGASA